VNAEKSLSLANRFRCTDNAVVIMASTFACEVYVQVNILCKNKK